MHLPGRLRTTTLGDLLGTLHRAHATGTLELAEDRGRTHRVHLSNGLVVAVELDGAGATLGEILRSEGAVDDDTLRRSLLRALTSRRLHGEVLVGDFRLAASIVDAALRRQLTVRLQRLEQLPDAQVLFRVTLRPPRSSLTSAPLDPRDFLSGRHRSRDRAHTPTNSAAARFTSTSAPNRPRPVADAFASRRVAAAPDPRRSAAWQVLGITPGADATEIKRAYRRLARSCHPDTHVGASEPELQRLAARFAEVTEAYKTLVA